jgi:hypothetical protein
MAYMSQEKKAVIAAKIKPILAKYGVKGSLSVSNHMTIVLTLKSGKIDFISNFNKTASQNPRYNEQDFRPSITHVSVNPYWYHEHFSGTAKKFLKEAIAALYGADWFDHSDSQSDYFHTAYYIDLNVGRWNKPYIVTEV